MDERARKERTASISQRMLFGDRAFPGRLRGRFRQAMSEGRTEAVHA
jgi:hypothetical protein